MSLFLGGLYDFLFLALQLSIPLSTYHAFLFSLYFSSCLSLSLSLALCFCRLDLSQLFAGFNDEKILIELLCNSTGQCLNRQLDINRPAYVWVHLHGCLCVFVRGMVWGCVSVVKSLPIDPARCCCDLLLLAGSHPWDNLWSFMLSLLEFYHIYF